MTAEVFDEILKTLCDAKPFKVFTFELDDGSRFEVDFPGAYRDGVAAYLSPRGAPTIFRHDNIKRIIASQANSDIGRTLLRQRPDSVAGEVLAKT